MTYDYQNTEVSQNLKAQTARKADVALHKKRFRIITASSFAAVVCAAVVIFFSLGGGPLPDVVVENASPTSAVSIEGLYSNGAADEEMALNYARQRHVRIYKLSKPEISPSTEIDFSENGTFVTLLNYENIAQELSEYGFLYEPPSEELYEDRLYYMVAFEAPSYQFRYVHLGIQFSDDRNFFKYISIDNDPVISGEYGLARPADDGSMIIGYLVVMPSYTKDTPLTAEKVLWSDLTDEEKTEAVIDTVLLNDDLNEILGSGVESSLTYELEILKKIGLPAIEHLRQYYSAPAVGNPGMDIARYLLYSLLNDYQLENYDLEDPEQAIKKWFSNYILGLDYNSRTPDCLIIPEVYVTEKILGQETPSFIGAASVFSYKPPMILEERNFLFKAWLSKNANGEWKVQSVDFVNWYGNISEDDREKYSGIIEGVDLDEIRYEQYYSAQALYDELTSYSPGEATSSTPTPANAVISDFDEIKRYLLSQYDEVYGSYSAISRDLVTYILDKSKGDNVLEIKTMTPLSEDFDNPITVAALSVTYDGSETESQYCKLYVVTAEYDESTWELIDMKIEEKSRLYMAEFPKLKFRGSRYVFLNLQSQLERETKKIGDEFGLDLPEPIIEKNVTSNELNLGFASGTPQFVSVTREIYPEEDAGVTSYMWYVEEDPVWLCDDARLDAIKNAEWEKIAEPTEKNIAGYSVSEPGLVGIRFEVHVENETSLYKAHFTIDAQTRFTTLWLSGINGDSAFYRSYDTAIYDAVVDIFGVDLDVSAFMITSGKGPTLPDYREELRFLVPIVGDMPGGIMSVEATDLSSLSADSGRYENTPVIKDEDALIDWAQEVGAILETCEIDDLGGGIIDTLAPDAIWEVNLAPQEGVGSLKIRGFADTGSIIIAKTYRLYGRSDTLYTVYQLNSFELFDKLCELSFGETLRD